MVGTATQLAVAGTTASTTATTGSLRTAGGLGVAGAGWFGGDIFCDNAGGPTLQNELASTTNPTLIPNRADETTGIGWATAQLVGIVSGAAVVTLAAATVTFAQKIVQDDTTASTTTTSGSIQTDGGLGVVGAAFIGGLVTANGDVGFRYNGTLVPDQTYTDYALAMGTEATEIEVTFATATNQNLDLIQMNVNAVATVTDEGPSASSQMNLMHTLITHDTDDMDNLRLKCADFTVNVAKDAKDAYAYQGEIDITDAAIGGEAGVGGFVLHCPSGTVTGVMKGVIIAMQGASLPSTTSFGLYIQSNVSATLTEAIHIGAENGTTITSGMVFECGASGNITAAIQTKGANANITNFLQVHSLTGCFNTTASIGSQRGRILVNWGGTQRCIPVYDLS